MPVDVIGIPTDRRSSPDATPLPPSRLRLWRRPHGTLPCRPGYFPVNSMMLRSTGLHRAIHCIPRRTFALFTFCDTDRSARTSLPAIRHILPSRRVVHIGPVNRAGVTVPPRGGRPGGKRDERDDDPPEGQ